LSIDSFLSTHSDLNAVGKICIALALIPFEKEERLYSYALEGKVGWYEYLWNKLFTAKNSFQNNMLSIITFNYDRSLDYFFQNAIRGSFVQFNEQLTNQSLTSLISVIPILHIHGKLGQLPISGHPCRRYKPGFNSDELGIAWNQIKVISDHNYKSESYVQAYQILCNAERIYFLGFGYHVDNLEMLAVDQIKGKIIYGTSFGLGDSERESIFNRWNIHLPLPHCEILDFLKNHAKLD
jgi:hypothetical protein